MSFLTEINTILTSDTSLNSLIEGPQRYENLPSEWLGNTEYNEWMVWGVRRNNQNDCVSGKNIWMDYTLSVVVIQRNSNSKIDDMTQRLINYLNSYPISGGIQDIAFTSDQPTFDQLQGVYYNGLEFNVKYIES